MKKATEAQISIKDSKVSMLGGVQLIVTPQTIVRQPLVSMGFSRQEY